MNMATFLLTAILLSAAAMLFYLRFTLVALACFLLAVWGTFDMVHAQSDHGEGHAQYHDFYKDWKQPGSPKINPWSPTGGVSCCNKRVVRRDNQGLPNIDGDCYPTEFKLGPKGWIARLSPEDSQLHAGQEWIDVPDAKIIREKNPDQTGRDGHLCVSISDGRVLCAVPPTGTF